MHTFDQLLQRAARLFALARKTREEGQSQLAKELARLATDSYEKATKLKNIRKAPRRKGAYPAL